MKEKTILGSGAVLVLIAILAQYTGNPVNSPTNVVGNMEGGINVTLLANAGVMIEAKDMRIYIDPIDLPREYSDSPADVILVTHDHGDHYQASTINMLQKDGTVNVFPAIMDTEIARHNGVEVVPEDELTFGPVTVTAFYMYTFSPVATTPASHPVESDYTSYIIDIDGFTIFHAGDSKNIQEYEELTGTISVALLPLGPGCQTMANDEVVNVIQIIEPEYFIPIHFTEGGNNQFVSRFRRSIEATTNCEICNLNYFTTHSFETS
ncbi:MAG: MBL fold metallo-hydrolase [Candidatus Bathyarchaeota archaeon]|nr:MBL fold metallo-hydrolase [Candidatus Bathyarchaeota archaeon]